jgi:hypothetical protein
MTRLLTPGAETQSIITTAGLNNDDGYSAGTVATALETTVVRGGKAAYKFVAGSGQTCFQRFDSSAQTAIAR